MQIAASIPRPVRPFCACRRLRRAVDSAGRHRPGRARRVAIVAYQHFFTSAPQAPVGQVVPVQRGNVAATVSATGSVVATHQARLVFASAGRIQDIQVGVGDHVSAGQPLARPASDATQNKLDTATSQLTTAQIKLQQLTEAASPADLAAAQAAYDAAVAKLSDLQNGPTAADLQMPGSGGARRRRCRRRLDWIR